MKGKFRFINKIMMKHRKLLLISIGFVAIEICAYIVLIRLLPILPPLKQNDHNRHEASKA